VVGASISRTVRDEIGSGIAAAAVSVRNVETGAERKLVADEAGRYSATWWLTLVVPSTAGGRARR
jgi:hypothetical protein